MPAQPQRYATLNTTVSVTYLTFRPNQFKSE